MKNINFMKEDKVLIDEKPTGFVLTRLRTSLFYLHVGLICVFGIILYVSNNSHKMIVFPMLFFPLLYTFFVVRDNIFHIKMEDGNIQVNWVHWFFKKEIIIPIKELELIFEVKYQSNSNVLIIKWKRIKIYQAQTSIWTKKVQGNIYNELKELKVLVLSSATKKPNSLPSSK